MPAIQQSGPNQRGTKFTLDALHVKLALGGGRLDFAKARIGLAVVILPLGHLECDQRGESRKAKEERKGWKGGEDEEKDLDELCQTFWTGRPPIQLLMR
jgi:hypothetical protein